MTQAATQFIRANTSHIAGFLDLQAKNLLPNVPKGSQENGFVTTPFTMTQLEHMIAKEDVFIALNEQEVIGYIVCASWDFLSQYLIFAYMATLLPDVTQLGEKITMKNSYQYGPICIAEEWRGKGIFEPFFAYARGQMQSKYRYGLTFVNTRNRRSRAAHERKLGLQRLDPFSFSGQNYAMFGFATTQTMQNNVTLMSQKAASELEIMA